MRASVRRAACALLAAALAWPVIAGADGKEEAKGAKTPVAPKLEVGDAFEARADNLAFPLRVVATDAASDLTLQVQSLWGPAGKGKPPECAANTGAVCDAAKFSLAAKEVREFEFSAGGLDRIGAYQALVTLRHAGGVESKTIKFNRVARAAELTVHGAEPRGDSSAWFTLVATGDAKIVKATVLSLTRTAGQRDLSVNYKGIELLNEDATPVALPFSMPVSSAQVRWAVRFKDLGPGQYAGKLGLQVDGVAQPVDVQITQLASRWSWCWAALAIAIGAAVSEVIRRYSSLYRPAMKRAHRIASLRVMIEQVRTGAGALTVDEEAPILAVSGLVDRLVHAEAFDPPVETQFQSDADALEARIRLLPKWVAVRRRIVALEPAKLREPLLVKLDAQRAALTTVELNATAADFVTLDADVTTAVRTRFAELRAELELQIDRHADVATAPWKLAAKANIAQASRDIADESKIKEALALLEETRAAYVAKVFADLRDRLGGLPPPFVEQEAWTALQAAAQPMMPTTLPSDPELAKHLYDQVWALYVGKIARAWNHKLLELQAWMQSAPGQSAPERLKTVYLALLDKVSGLAGNPAAVDAATLDGVASDLQTLDQLLDAEGAGHQMGKAEAIPGMPGIFADPSRWSADVVLADAGRTTLAEPRELDEIRSLSARIKSGDWYITVLAGLLTVLAGMQTLYVGSPAWGGWADLWIALAWGVGLQLGAAGTLQTVAGVRQKLTSAT